MIDHKTKLEKTCKIIYKLLIFPETDWKTKIYCNTFLSYLVNPNDIIPDKEKEGFIDDLYLGLIILRDLNKYRPKLIEKIANGEELINWIDTNLQNIELKQSKLKEIENFSGYSSLNDFDLGNKKTNNQTKRYLLEKSKLIGSIAFFYNKSKVNEEKKLDAIFNFVEESGDFFEIKRILSGVLENKDYSEKLKVIELMENVFFDYEKFINKISNEKEDYHLLKYLPKIFKTLYKIYSTPNCPDQIKHKINSAFAYLAIYEDVIDDSEEGGLLDDLFILSLVLKDIYDLNRGVVYSNLEDITIKELRMVLIKTEMRIYENIGEVINYLGLKGIFEFYDLNKQVAEKEVYGDIYIKVLIKQNNRLIHTLRKISESYFGEKFKVRGPTSIKEVQEEIKSNLSNEEVEVYEKFIKKSKKLAYIDNLDEKQDNDEKEEMELLILKHQILEEL
jgi:uncharacterized membrane protein YkvA (DUF1232 family)